MKLKKIKKICDLWIYRLGLRWWEVTVNYIEDPQTIIDIFRVSDDSIVIAKTFSDWRYMTANIYLNIPPMLTMSSNQIQRIIVHELLHVLVNEMRNDGIDHEERVVTMLTKAVFWIKTDIETK